MIIGYNLDNAQETLAEISKEKLQLSRTLDRISRRAYLFLALLAVLALCAFLFNYYSGQRITQLFPQYETAIRNVHNDLTLAGHRLTDNQMPLPELAESLHSLLSEAEGQLRELPGDEQNPWSSVVHLSMDVPDHMAEQTAILHREITATRLLAEQLQAESTVSEQGEAVQRIRSAIDSQITRASNLQGMLQAAVGSEALKFRNSGALTALAIIMLAVFAAMWFRRSDRLRTIQFKASVVAEEGLRRREVALQERIKELNCLYSFSQIIESNNKTLDQMMNEVVNIIPEGWKHSEDACARIIVGERSYQTEGFKETPWMQVEPLKLNNQVVGSLQVAYLTKKPDAGEGPFIVEERALLRALADQLDSLLHSYQLRDQVQASRKYEAIGALISGITHDFNNILFAIMGNAEMALAALDDDSASYSKMKRIVQATNRARDLTRQLISCTRPVERERDSIPVNRVVDEVLKLVRASLPSTIRIDTKYYKPQTYVFAQFTEIHQIILNLCSNSGYAMRESGGTLRISVDEIQLRRSYFKPGGVVNADAILAKHPNLQQGMYVRISIRDEGCGIPEGVMKRIFDPFFSTKPSSEGTGMGLFNVREIVNKLNGAVVAESWPGEGSLFQIYLPSAPPAISAGDLQEYIPRGSERILLVDDEREIVSMLDAMLTELGYTVTTFTDSRRALQDFAANPEDYDLLLTDYTMPDMTGIKLMDHICDIKPGIPAIMMSGNDDPPPSSGGCLDEYIFLNKPVKKIDLANTIRKAVSRKLELETKARKLQPA